MKERSTYHGPQHGTTKTMPLHLQFATGGEDGRPKHPVLSFFQVLVQRFEERMQEQQEQQQLADDEHDDDFVNITFSSIDDVIEFYRSDNEEEDAEGDSDSREGAVSDRIPHSEQGDFHDCMEDDDDIVSSWIDNYHFLLAEQEKRKQRQKRVRFEATEPTIYKNFDEPSSKTILFLAGDDFDADAQNDGDDDCSLASSCCSSSTEATFDSLDTMEEQEFEKFASQWRKRGLHGKNTEKSLLARWLREVLVGPLDEDFEGYENIFELDNCEEYDGAGTDPLIRERATANGEFPSDLLFSIETQ